MIKVSDEGQAFPRAGFSGPSGFGKPAYGMTLRDYFAAKAMQGICAHHDTWGLTSKEICQTSYRPAPETLKARGQE